MCLHIYPSSLCSLSKMSSMKRSLNRVESEGDFKFVMLSRDFHTNVLCKVRYKHLVRMNSCRQQQGEASRLVCHTNMSMICKFLSYLWSAELFWLGVCSCFSEYMDRNTIPRSIRCMSCFVGRLQAL